MSKPLYLIIITSLLCGRAIAQLPFATRDSIDVNNINARVLVHGDMWWDPADEKAHCNYPAASPKNINFAGAVWMSAYDAGGQLHVAAQTYRQGGNDYWPGPLSGTTAISYTESEKWAKIWKVNRSDIDAFRAQSTHTFINTDLSILTWPGKNNPFARGNNNEPLVVDNDMAPFADLNGNGKYEPLAGEYPAIKGEQALWNVFNDNGPAHTQSNGRPLGVEVHAMTYAYKRGTLIDNVIYYEYTLTNRSVNNYTNFRLAIWDDMDLGYYLDDYIGFDSSRRMGICYNATNDDGASGGHPLNSYGVDPPMAGLSLIDAPGDVGTNYVPAGSFMYYNNDASIIGNPVSDTICNYYLRARFADGTHLKRGHNGNPAFVGPDCNYVFDGDPSLSAEWSECSSNNNPGDRRFMLASNDFNLNAGETKKVVWAFVVADSAGGCGRTDFSKIRAVADTAWAAYHSRFPAAVTDAQAGNIRIYPNPAHDRLFIEDPNHNTADAHLSIYSSIGKLMPVAADAGGKSIDISSYPEGLYHVVYRNNGVQMVVKVVKD